jgi:hypothetical protein
MPDRFVESLESRALLAADLTGSFVSLKGPTSAIAGEQIKGAAVVKVANSDATKLGKSDKVSVQVVLRPQGGGNDILVGAATNQSLNGIAGTKTKNVTVKLDSKNVTVPAGTYSVVAIVDSGNAVAESDESNNEVVASGALTVDPSTADVGVTAVTTNFDSKAKAKSAQVTLANTGNQKVKGKVDIQVVAISNGTETVLGTLANQNVTLNPGKTLKKTVKLTTPAAGTYSIVARITPSIAPADTNSANNSFTGADVTVAGTNTGGGNNNGGGGQQGVDYFAQLGVGSTLTFTKTGDLPGNGIVPGAIMETGTFVDNNGRTGTYQLVLNSSLGGKNALKLNQLNLTWNAFNGQQSISRGLYLEFKSFAARGNTGYNGKSFVFTPSSAGSVATVTVNPAVNGVVFYMKPA